MHEFEMENTSREELVLGNPPVIPSLYSLAMKTLLTIFLIFKLPICISVMLNRVALPSLMRRQKYCIMRICGKVDLETGLGGDTKGQSARDRLRRRRRLLLCPSFLRGADREMTTPIYRLSLSSVFSSSFQQTPFPTSDNTDVCCKTEYKDRHRQKLITKAQAQARNDRDYRRKRPSTETQWEWQNQGWLSCSCISQESRGWSDRPDECHGSDEGPRSVPSEGRG